MVRCDEYRITRGLMNHTAGFRRLIIEAERSLAVHQAGCDGLTQRRKQYPSYINSPCADLMAVISLIYYD